MSIESPSCIISKSRKCKFLGKLIDSKLVFIAGPSHDEFKQDIETIKSLLKKYNLDPYFATDEIHEIGYDAFCDKICSKIIQSRFCIVVLNNPLYAFDKEEFTPELKTRLSQLELRNFNANVYLEYGMMTAFGKKRIPIIQRGHRLPFNIQGIDTVLYQPIGLKDAISSYILNMIDDTEIITHSGLQPVPHFDLESEKLVKGFIKRETSPNDIQFPPKIRHAPIVEILVGPINPTKEWMPITLETQKILQCAPFPMLKDGELKSRGDHFEVKSSEESLYRYRVDKYGLFYYRDNLKQETEYVIVGDLIFIIFEILGFNVRVLKLKGSTEPCKILVRMSGISKEKVFLSRKTRFRPWPRIDYDFGADQDDIKITDKFNPIEPWPAIIELTCRIYKKICEHIGALDLVVSEDQIKRNIEAILVNQYHTAIIRYSYPDVGLKSISREELFGII